MPALSVKAHFDGEHIQLDEPCALEKGAQLIVMVISPELAAERESWFNFASQSFARCYGPDEPEYTDADILRE
jgi:hypothetical protein